MQWYDYYIRCWKHYFDFKGRARRAEWIIFVACNRTIHNLCKYIGELEGNVAIIVSVVALLFGLVTFIPEVVVCVRRLHDVGKTGWWMTLPVLLAITTYVFLFVFQLEKVGIALYAAYGVTMICLIIVSIKDGQPGVNKWGPNPKEKNNTLQISKEKNTE